MCLSFFYSIFLNTLNVTVAYDVANDSPFVISAISLIFSMTKNTIVTKVVNDDEINTYGFMRL